MTTLILFKARGLDTVKAIGDVMAQTYHTSVAYLMLLVLFAELETYYIASIPAYITGGLLAILFVVGVVTAQRKKLTKNSKTYLHFHVRGYFLFALLFLPAVLTAYAIKHALSTLSHSALGLPHTTAVLTVLGGVAVWVLFGQRKDRRIRKGNNSKRSKQFEEIIMKLFDIDKTGVRLTNGITWLVTPWGFSLGGVLLGIELGANPLLSIFFALLLFFTGAFTAKLLKAQVRGSKRRTADADYNSGCLVIHTLVATLLLILIIALSPVPAIVAAILCIGIAIAGSLIGWLWVVSGLGIGN